MPGQVREHQAAVEIEINTSGMILHVQLDNVVMKMIDNEWRGGFHASEGIKICEDRLGGRIGGEEMKMSLSVLEAYPC